MDSLKKLCDNGLVIWKHPVNKMYTIGKPTAIETVDEPVATFEEAVALAKKFTDAPPKYYWWATAMHNQGFGEEFIEHLVDAVDLDEAQRLAEDKMNAMFTKKKYKKWWDEVRVRPATPEAIHD